jgi:hypothetical protein
MELNVRELFKILMITVCLSSNYFVNAQIYNFTIFYANDSIGKVQAKKSYDNLTETIEITSKSQFSILLMSQSIKTNCISVFKNNELISNHSTLVRNKNLEKVYTKKQDEVSYYQCVNNSGKLIHLSKKINFTVSQLYFKEPTFCKEIYSESHQQFCPIIKVKEHTYKLVLPDSNVNYYVYKNGVLEMMYSDRMGGLLQFKRN